MSYLLFKKLTGLEKFCFNFFSSFRRLEFAIDFFIFFFTKRPHQRFGGHAPFSFLTFATFFVERKANTSSSGVTYPFSHNRKINSYQYSFSLLLPFLLSFFFYFSKPKPFLQYRI